MKACRETSPFFASEAFPANRPADALEALADGLLLLAEGKASNTGLPLDRVFVPLLLDDGRATYVLGREARPARRPL